MPSCTYTRLVESELRADRGHLLLRGVQAAQDHRRVGAEVLEEEEHQHHHADQRGHHLPQAPDEIGPHGCALPRAPSEARAQSEECASVEARRAGPDSAFALRANPGHAALRRRTRLSHLDPAAGARLRAAPQCHGRSVLSRWPCGRRSCRPRPQRKLPRRKVLRYAFPIAETGFDPAQVTDLYSNVAGAHLRRAAEYEYLARRCACGRTPRRRCRRSRPTSRLHVPDQARDLLRRRPGVQGPGAAS